MMHDHHEQLSGYHPTQIWHDGCAECEARGASVPQSIGTLDANRLARAIAREYAWDHASDFDHSTLSRAEIPLLRFLYYVRIVNERTLREAQYLTGASS